MKGPPILWEPTRFESVQRHGKTKPIVLDCAHAQGTKEIRRRLLVKALGLPHVYTGSLCNEWLGGHLARAYGLQAPEVVLVDLSEDFITDAADDLAARGVAPKAGVAVGIELIENLVAFPSPASIDDEERAAAVDILLFDLLVQNPDRRPENPNCGRAKGQIIPFDYEHAFSFLDALLKDKPWRLGGLPFAKTHLFSECLRGSDWKTLVPAFLAKGQSAFQGLCSSIPECWPNTGSDIAAHIRAVNEHADLFAEEVHVSQGSGQWVG